MIRVNGVLYEKPKNIVVVVCMDGADPCYLDKAIKANKAQTFKKFIEEGFYSVAESVMPSYTNPNNVAIITGTPPRINGITGNWMYDKKQNKERYLNSPEYLRCETILEAFYKQGIKVALVTAKDKLRRILGKGWEGIKVSAELAHEVKRKNDHVSDVIRKTMKINKSKTRLKVDKWMYSGKASHYALELALALIESKGPYKPQLLYVSLTDYIPHKEKPGSEAANKFFQGINNYLAKLDRIGCILGITADHGMNDKHNPDGSPKVIWLSDELNKARIRDYKVVLPVKDQYTAHHGSLGGAAWVYSKNTERVINVLSKLSGIEEVVSKEEAIKKYDLPVDLIGDVMVLGDKETVLGISEREHGTTPLFLRSHGSIHESLVPFITNKPLKEEYLKKSKERLKNFQIFDYTINGVKA